MNTRVQIFQAAENQADPVPEVLRRCREFVATTANGDMRLHGIKSITIAFKQVGLRVTNDVSFEPFDEDPPDALLALRNTVVRQTADRLFLYGILGIELFPNEAEMQTIRDGWTAMATGQGPGANTAATTPKTGDKIEMINLNVEQDPSGESVVEPESDPAPVEEVPDGGEPGQAES